MPFKIPDYPEILTQTDWDKKKGVFAKIFSKKTGIGDAMKAAKAAFDAVAWEKFRLAHHMPQGKDGTLQKLEELKKEALAEGGKIKALDTKVRDLEKLALEVHGQFKANKLMPKSAVDHIQKVHQAAKEFDYAITMGTISDALEKEYEENKVGIETVMKVHAQGRERFMHYVEKVIAGVDKTYTKDGFNDFWSEDIRGVGTQLPVIVATMPELKGELTVWRKFGDQAFLATDADTPETIAKKCTMVKTVILKIKQKLDTGK